MGSWWSFTALTSAPEEVQDVGECTGIGLVDLGVRALRARDRGELLVLDVEELCQAAPGRTSGDVQGWNHKCTASLQPKHDSIH